MTWYDDFGGGTYQTSTGNIAFGESLIYYDRKFLKRATETVVLYPFGQRRPLPKGAGRTIQFYRWNEIALDSSYNALNEGVNPNATTVSGQEVNATIAEYGAFSQHSSLIKDTHIDRNLDGVIGLWGDQAGRTVDMLTWQEVALYGNCPIRADALTNNAAASYSLYDVATQTSTNNTSVAVIAASATVGTTADFWNGGILTVTAGTNEGQSRVISDYASSGTWATITVASGFEAACDATSVLRIQQSTGLTAGDIPTYDCLREIKARMTKSLAPKFKNGYYIMVAEPDVLADLMSDSRFTNMTQYNPDGGYYTGEVGKMHGFRMVETTQSWRHTAGTVGTRVAAGRVYSSLCLGKEAFGVTGFPGRNRPKIIIKNPGPQDTSNPLNRYSTVGWRFDFVPKALNAKWCWNLWSYH